MRFLITDPKTHKKSITITLLVLSFLLFVATIICHLAGVSQDWKLPIIALFAVGIFFAGYHRQRLKLGFSGVEIEEECNATDSSGSKP